jgi:hypothetical protein
MQFLLLTRPFSAYQPYNGTSTEILQTQQDEQKEYLVKFHILP